MTDEPISPTPLRRPTSLDADTIAGWHPIPPEEVFAWWDGPDVEPWVTVATDGRLVGYGELWLDAEENEVELARLIVAPELRGRGLGQRLVRVLVAKAAATGLATAMLRVEPDNVTAIRCYLSSGFQRLSSEESAQWNEGQRREWAWMTATREQADSLGESV